MARGSLITPLIPFTKPANNSASTERPQTADLSRMSSSSVFPALRRLETSSGDGSLSPRRSMSLRPSTASGALDRSNTTSSSSRAPGDTSLLNLRFSGPSFLDVVVKDGETKDAMYILETVRESTCIYRLNGPTREAIKAATVQWPQTLVKGKGKTGRTVQMGEGRWRDSEEFLKYGALGNTAYVYFLVMRVSCSTCRCSIRDDVCRSQLTDSPRYQESQVQHPPLSTRLEVETRAREFILRKHPLASSLCVCAQMDGSPHVEHCSALHRVSKARLRSSMLRCFQHHHVCASFRHS